MIPPAWGRSLRLFIAAIFSLTVSLPTPMKAATPDQFVFIGTQTSGKSVGKGIYTFEFDSASGQLRSLGLQTETSNPTFLAFHPSGKYLYCVAEGGEAGQVKSFAINPETTQLTEINSKSSGGRGPCFVGVDQTGRALLVANYGSGDVASLPIMDDGSLGEPVSTIRQAPASNANPGRQSGPHAHSFLTDPSNRFALSGDLGCDRVFVYALDPATAQLTPNEAGAGIAPPGGGPRHVAFHSSGRFVYANNELDMTLTVYRFENGALTPLQTISTLPDGTPDDKSYSTAETLVHPSDRFLYVSNRGHDSIAIYQINQQTGLLSGKVVVPSRAKTPRNFGIDKTGRWLIAAGLTSNDLAVFSIDQETGHLEPHGDLYGVGSPVCVRFLPR